VDSSEWDERYAGHEQMWSGRPNGTLVLEVAALTPGTALDVGCGEGGDAVWLAERGWQVTGLDVSQVALTRARAAARARSLDVEWVCAPLAELRPRDGGYDLVTVHYPALLHTPGDDAIHAMLAAVAPGGTLLVVGHERIDPEHARALGFDPADYVQAPDVAAHLSDGWHVETDQERPRIDPAPAGTEHVHDHVLRARRIAGTRGPAPDRAQSTNGG
jgi:SAM-dependent methyltransferase